LGLIDFQHVHQKGMHSKLFLSYAFFHSILLQNYLF
jgi:hypothetical protein